MLYVSLQSTKSVYDRIIDLRIATPQIIINYAMFLEEHNYFEESFKVRLGAVWVLLFLKKNNPPKKTTNTGLLA